MRPLYIAAIAIAVLFLLALARLARLDAAAPAHQFVNLPGQEPATLYLPGDQSAFFRVLPPANPPPAVVLIHGFTADRQLMSTLARFVAQNGYAVLAIDVSGHGTNRNPFTGGQANWDGLRPDVKKAVDFLRGYPFVDGSRIVVMGHSMGAGAALDYATVDPQLRGAVMISGGFALAAGEHPKNALFIYAQNDPDFIKSSSAAIAAHLAGVPSIESGKAYGDFRQGTAVEAVEMPGLDHMSIVFSPDAAAAMIKWLDSSMEVSRAGELNLANTRRNTARIALLLFVLMLIPLGKIAGEIAGQWSEAPAGVGGWWGLLIVFAGLAAAMPLVGAVAPVAFFPLVVGDAQISWFMAAGVIIGIILILSRSLDWHRFRRHLWATILAAGIAMIVIYLAEVGMSVVLHSLTLSPERFIFAILGAILTFPFWYGFEFMLRRGSLTISTLRASLGRALIIVMIVAGAFLQVLPFVLLLILPVVFSILALMEVFAASAYSSSRNLALIAIVDSAWFAWIIAATNPITFMF